VSDAPIGAISPQLDFLIGLGDVLFAIGRFKEAYVKYIQTLQLRADSYQVWLKTGITLYRLKKTDEALEVFDALLEQNSYDGELWLAHGLAMLELGQKEKAKESLINARRYKPNQPTLWYALAKLEKDADSGRWVVKGDPTEGALVVTAAKADLWKEDLEKQQPRIGELPFSSETKRMTTLHVSTIR
jgi:tetratricopeptide (TPR) repeat protein